MNAQKILDILKKVPSTAVHAGAVVSSSPLPYALKGTWGTPDFTKPVDIHWFLRTYGTKKGAAMAYQHVQGGGKVFHVSMEANDDPDFLTKVMDLGQKEAGE